MRKSGLCRHKARSTMKTAVAPLCLLLLSLLPGCAASSDIVDESRSQPDLIITNNVLTLGVCKRDAGAVCSIIYKGHEFVNDYDHGRQMQVAWSYNKLDEDYNPTESGSVADDVGPTSSSVLISMQADSLSITTKNHPAYWKPARLEGLTRHQRRIGKGVNFQAATKDTLTKTITLGYNGDQHVIVVDSTAEISPYLTGVPIKSIAMSAPGFYTSAALTEHYLFDRHSGATITRSTAVKDKSFQLRLLSKDRHQVPILSTPDGRYAAGMYTTTETFFDYNTHSHFPSNSTLIDNACNRLSLHFIHPVETGKTYSYRTFIIIGDFETVKKSIMKLP